MNYDDMTDAQLAQASIEIGKKIRALHDLSNAYQQKIEDEIESLSNENVEINRVREVRAQLPRR